MRLAYFSVFVIDHHIVWLHVSMHDSHAVAIVETLQQLVQIETNVVIRESLIELLKIETSRSLVVFFFEGVCERGRIIGVDSVTLKSVLLTYSIMSAGVRDLKEREKEYKHKL